MDKENMIGTPEKALKDCLNQFEIQVKNVMMGLDYETAIIFLDKLSQRLNKVDKSMRKLRIDYE